MQLRQSERKRAKIKMALQGSAGSGKTMSALLIAQGLTQNNLSKVAIIDTENGSADLYAHLGNYNVLTLEPPFTPEKYIEAIDVCLEAGMSVIILDSISHSWDYLLDYHSKMPGNSFTNWSKLTPMQNSFVNKILQSNAHIIATMRVKQDYVLNNKNGKMVPEKVGLKAVQRNDLDYEFTIVFDLDIANNAKVSKDRTNLFSGRPEFKINASTGKKILEWCNMGNSLETILKEIEETTTIEGLRHLYQKYASLKDIIKPLIIKRKQELESISNQIVDNQEIINKPIHKNGIDSSKSAGGSE